MNRQDQRAALFLRPTVIGSLLLVAVNDGWAKSHHGSWTTGKLSDLAGVYALPVVVTAIFVRSRTVATVRVLVACSLATAVGFAAVKLTAEGNAAWGWTLGGLRWIVRAPLALLGHHGAVRRVEALQDPTDLIALLVAPLSVVLGFRAIRRASSPRLGPTGAGVEHGRPEADDVDGPFGVGDARAR